MLRLQLLIVPKFNRDIFSDFSIGNFSKKYALKGKFWSRLGEGLWENCGFLRDKSFWGFKRLGIDREFRRRENLGGIVRKVLRVVTSLRYLQV